MSSADVDAAGRHAAGASSLGAVRAAVIAAVWAVATAAALVLAWQTRVGPVIYRLSERHGVHLGDVVGFAIAYAWAAVLTIAIASTPPSRRQ